MAARVARLALVCLVALAATSCTERQRPPPQLAAPSTTDPGTTTTLPGGPEPLPPRTLAEIEADLEAAVAARDFCALVEALDDAAPDTEDGEVVIATYEALDAAVREARAFVPSELSASWVIVVDGVGEGLEAARRFDGDVGNPALRTSFVDSRFESAMTAVETFADANCST